MRPSSVLSYHYVKPDAQRHIIKGSERWSRPWPRSCRCNGTKFTQLCVTTRSRRPVCEYADAQGGPPGHRDGAAVAPVRRQLLAASRSAAPRWRWTSWKSRAGGGTRSALGKQHRKLQQGFVAVYAVARTTAPIVASEPARAQSSGCNGSSSEQLFSYLSSSESEAVFTADQLQRLRERRGVVGAPPPPP
jgi:hypothetical protein